MVLLHDFEKKEVRRNVHGYGDTVCMFKHVPFFRREGVYVYTAAPSFSVG